MKNGAVATFGAAFAKAMSQIADGLVSLASTLSKSLL